MVGDVGRQQRVMLKSNTCTAQSTFEFGLLRKQRYSNFEYLKFLGTAVTLPGLRLLSEADGVREQSTSIRGSNRNGKDC